MSKPLWSIYDKRGFLVAALPKSLAISTYGTPPIDETAVRRNSRGGLDVMSLESGELLPALEAKKKIRALDRVRPDWIRP